jgi:hypothetical protein
MTLMCLFEVVSGELVLIMFYCDFKNGRPAKSARSYINKPEIQFLTCLAISSWKEMVFALFTVFRYQKHRDNACGVGLKTVLCIVNKGKSLLNTRVCVNYGSLDRNWQKG